MPTTTIHSLSKISIILSPYYTQTFKTKPSKTFLISLNWYRNAHYSVSNKVKNHYRQLIKKLLKGHKEPLLNESYRVVYYYYYKNKNSDMSNVCALIDKFFQDSIQELEIVSNDNVQYCKEVIFRVGGEDKVNPRVEVFLQEFRY